MSAVRGDPRVQRDVVGRLPGRAQAGACALQLDRVADEDVGQAVAVARREVRRVARERDPATVRADRGVPGAAVGLRAVQARADPGGRAQHAVAQEDVLQAAGVGAAERAGRARERDEAPVVGQRRVPRRAVALRSVRIHAGEDRHLRPGLARDQHGENEGTQHSCIAHDRHSLAEPRGSVSWRSRELRWVREPHACVRSAPRPARRPGFRIRRGDPLRVRQLSRAYERRAGAASRRLRNARGFPRGLRPQVCALPRAACACARAAHVARGAARRACRVR